jgi:hypothetical protein
MVRICESCGLDFDGRSDARYCGNTCRSKASRATDNKLSVAEGGIATDKVDATDNFRVGCATDNSLKLVDPNDPKVIDAGRVISEKKRHEMLTSDLPVIDSDVPCRVSPMVPKGEFKFDLVKDLKLNLQKDLGIFAWSADGIFIRPDITIDQVRNIRSIVEAKHGWPHRTYEDSGTPYSTSKLGARA